MSHFICFVWRAYLAWSCSTTFLVSAESVTGKDGVSTTTVPGTAASASVGIRDGVVWLADYAQAWDTAQREGKMLLVYFRRSGERHPVYGYDMKQGDNGVWYATGIFGRR